MRFTAISTKQDAAGNSLPVAETRLIEVPDTPHEISENEIQGDPIQSLKDCFNFIQDVIDNLNSVLQADTFPVRKSARLNF